MRVISETNGIGHPIGETEKKIAFIIIFQRSPNFEISTNNEPKILILHPKYPICIAFGTLC